MPIKITNYEWIQTAQTIIVTIGLRYQNIKKVSVICTSSYLKVNFNPYIFELFLCKKIDPVKSTSVFKDGFLHIHLCKCGEEEWKELSLLTKSKKELNILRREALKEHEELEQSKLKTSKDKRASLQNFVVSKQISENESNYEFQKRYVEEQKKMFFQEKNEESSNPLCSSKEAARPRLISLCSEDGSTAASEGDYDGDGEESIGGSSSQSLRRLSKSGQETEKCDPNISSSPPSVRESCTIRIRHSSHENSLPRRLSTSKSNQNVGNEASEALVGHQEENLKIEAIKCFKNKNFEEAVRMYSTLIELSPEQASYYSNRAAAYIALNAYDQAVADCSKALEMLKPPTEGNAKSRLLCLVRRGTSRIHMNDTASGLIDYEAALQLDPNNVSLGKDVAVIKASLASCSTELDSTFSDEELSPPDCQSLYTDCGNLSCSSTN